MGVKLDNERWYEHVPKLLETGHKGKVTILWKKQVQNDRTIPNNKPDIIVRDNKNEHACRQMLQIVETEA